MNLMDIFENVHRDDPETVIRPDGWRCANDVPQSWSRPGCLYRGMSEAEYRSTVGAGLPLKSDGRYCLAGEGTCFAEDATDAESYVNFGHTDPRISGKPNYLIEIEADSSIKKDKDGYWKAPTVSLDRIRRVWKMYARGSEIVALRIGTGG